MKVTCHTILVYDVLHKRKPFLDSLSEGLEVFGIQTLIKLFPEIMKPLFVNSGDITSVDVIKILKPSLRIMNQEEKRL